ASATSPVLWSRGEYRWNPLHRTGRLPACPKEDLLPRRDHRGRPRAARPAAASCTAAAVRLLREVDQLSECADALLKEARGHLDRADGAALSSPEARDVAARAAARSDAAISQANDLIDQARAKRKEARGLIREAHCIRVGRCGCEVCAELE